MPCSSMAGCPRGDAPGLRRPRQAGSWPEACHAGRMRTDQIRQTYDSVDRGITDVLARIGVPAVRIALGIVFFWFGVLKLFPGLSPAEDLAARTIQTLSGGAFGPSLS